MSTLLTLAALMTLAPPEPTEVRLIGVVSEHGVGVCKDRHTTEWTNKHYRVGDVEMAAGSVDLSAHLGESVVVTGKVTGEGGPTPSSPLGTTPCGMEQMRNDWYATPEGIREWSGGSTPFGKLVATKVEPYSGTQLTRKGKNLMISIASPKDAAPLPLTVDVEYLGNAGKPNSSYDRRETTLKPGGSVTLSFVASRGVTKGNDQSGESVHNLRISGGAGALYFDLRLRPPGPRK